MFVPCAPRTSTYDLLFSGRYGRFYVPLNEEKERKEMYATQMLEKISVLSAEDSSALQQKYTWETLLKLQLT